MVIGTQVACLEADAKARNAEALSPRPRAVDRADEARDRQAPARAVRPILGTRRRARATRALACRQGRGCVPSGRPRRRWRQPRRRTQRLRCRPSSGASRRAGHCRSTCPRERVVYPSPSPCPCCGGVLHKLGEDINGRERETASSASPCAQSLDRRCAPTSTGSRPPSTSAADFGTTRQHMAHRVSRDASAWACGATASFAAATMATLR